ncbi:hypothetical protein BC835DRAFT_218388 [Cytidiella melzeri]|nr:hypothetical protein BC835DRAFT_218388 [Cytidiella melzeri]
MHGNWLPWYGRNNAHRMPTPRHFPSEIVDHITDHLWDDKTSLAACTLVCKQWLFSATFHLFRTLTLCDDVHFCLFREFIGMLCLNSPRTFGHCVRALHLQSSPPGQETTPLIEINLHLLATIILACPRLEHLQLTRVRWSRQHTNDYPPIVAPSITTLSLTYRSSHFLPDFTGIFAWFPNLRACVLDGGYIPTLESYNQPGRKHADPIPFPRHMQLSVLHMRSHMVSPWIWDWVSATASVHSLQSLEAALGRPENLYGLARVLSGVRHILLDLRLDLTSTDYRMFFLTSGAPATSVGSLLPLRECDAIQRLELTTMIVQTQILQWDIPPVTTAPLHIAGIIALIPSTTFTHLTLRFTGSLHHAPWHLNIPEWSVVEHLLLNHPTIRVVEVVWEDSWNGGRIQDAICTVFPLLYSHGKLRFRQ